MSAGGSGLRAGVIGTGSLGNHHARIYASTGDVEELLLWDLDGGSAAGTADRWGGRVSRDLDALLDACDMVSICTPATAHMEIALAAFERGADVLVEKPIAAEAGEGGEIVRAARSRGRILQVGHIERFNGAFEAAASLASDPRFIECHRLGTFTPRGTDVSVVVDLMIHDIDLVLSMLEGRRLVELRASGAGVLTGSPDIVNARLEFDNGCVANLTASRISREPFRKIRLFQENLYVSADLRGRTVEAFERAGDVTMGDLSDDPTAFIRPIEVEVDRGEPLRKEIESFVRSVRRRSVPVVTGEQALDALETAERVLDEIGKAGRR